MTDDVVPLRLTERLLIGLIALILSGGVLPLFVTPNQDFNYVEGNPAFQIVLALMYFAAAWIALYHFHSVRVALFRAPALPALLLLAFVSATWSPAPILVLRRSTALLGTSLFGLVLALVSLSNQLKDPEAGYSGCPLS